MYQLGLGFAEYNREQENILYNREDYFSFTSKDVKELAVQGSWAGEQNNQGFWLLPAHCFTNWGVALVLMV